MLLCAHGLCSANQVKPGQGPVAAICRTIPTLQATFPTALRPHKAAIVLPAFTRSSPYDGCARHLDSAKQHANQNARKGQSERAAGSLACVVARLS